MNGSNTKSKKKQRWNGIDPPRLVIYEVCSIDQSTEI